MVFYVKVKYPIRHNSFTKTCIFKIQQSAHLESSSRASKSEFSSIAYAWSRHPYLPYLGG